VSADERLKVCIWHACWIRRQVPPSHASCRLNASHEAAEKYIAQFPSPLLSHGARFVAFIAGSFAALLLGAALVDDQLLERRLGGRTLVWWATLIQHSDVATDAVPTGRTTIHHRPLHSAALKEMASSTSVRC
jgi:Autophagy protein ATG9